MSSLDPVFMIECLKVIAFGLGLIAGAILGDG